MRTYTGVGGFGFGLANRPDVLAAGREGLDDNHAAATAAAGTKQHAGFIGSSPGGTAALKPERLLRR